MKPKAEKQTPRTPQGCDAQGEFCVNPPRDGMTCHDPVTGALITCPEVRQPPAPEFCAPDLQVDMFDFWLALVFVFAKLFACR